MATAGAYTADTRAKEVNYSKYSKLGVLISKCCPMLLREHAKQHIESCKPSNHGSESWTIDHFLYTNRAAIERSVNHSGRKCTLTQTQKTLLFPGYGKTTDIEQWDLSLLSYILLEVCEPSRLLKGDIGHMQRMRNKLFHIGDPDIPEDKYIRYFNKINKIIKRSLTELDNAAFAKNMTELVTNIKSGSLTMDDPFKLVKEWFNQELLQTKWEGGPEGYRTVKEKLDLLQAKLFGEQSESELKIPGTEVVLLVQNCSSDKETYISQLLVDILAKNQHELPNISKEDFEKLKEVAGDCMRQLLSGGRQLKRIDTGCIIMNIICSSVANLSELWTECANDGVTKLFYPVQCCIRKLPGCENVDITALVNDSEVWICVDQLVSDMLAIENDRIHGDSHAVSVESRSDVRINATIVDNYQNGKKENEHNGAKIKINIQPTSIAQLRNVVDNCKSGEFNRSLGKVSETLQEVLNITDLTIDARFNEEQMSRTLLEAEQENKAQQENIDLGLSDQIVRVKEITDNEEFQRDPKEAEQENKTQQENIDLGLSGQIGPVKEIADNEEFQIVPKENPFTQHSNSMIHTQELKYLKQLIHPKPVDNETETRVVLQRVETMRLKRPVTLPDGPAELSQTQFKLRGVLQSLIDSEKNYIGSLDRLVSDYQRPITDQFGGKKLEKPEMKITFSQIENILNFHKLFKLELADKMDNWYAEEEIGNIFHMFSKRTVIDCYSDYVNNFEAASEIIKEMENSKPSFKELLRNKQMSSVDQLSLSGLMLKPIQRFPQFIRIIKDLLKYTPRDHHDREPLQEGLTVIENIAHQLNERKRQSEQYYHGQQIIKKLAPSLQPGKKVFLIRQDDMEQVNQDNTGVNNVKQRRLFLMNDKLVSVHVTHRDQDGESTERFTYKWHRSLQDLELTTSAITPNMHTRVHTEIRNTTILSPKSDLHTKRSDDDPISIAGELTDMMHDISVLAQVTQLVSTLKLAYPGLTEDHFHEITTNLQKEIQGKHDQLQISRTIIMQDKVRKKQYIFSAPSANVKKEWCIDFLLAKFALDVVNIPSWYKQDQDDISQPALLMKHMTVDMQRTFTGVKCSVPVYFPTKSEGSVEHLWVCSSTKSQGQVSLVPLYSAKPGLIESFQVTKCEILCVEMVPGFSTAFEEDTVWMSTADSEILVLMLSEKQSGLHRRAVYTFQPGSLVISMTYEDDCVFCGTAAGMLVVYSRNDDGIWTLSNKLSLGVGSVTSIITVNDSLWTACGNAIYVINPDKCVIKDKIHHQLADSEVHVNFLVKAGVGVWGSFIGQPNISLFHGESKRLLQDCNICTAINDFISVYSGNKETSKKYEVTCLMASLGLLWVGTNVGIILTYPLPRLRDGVPRINHRPHVALHGHNGPVKFIIPVYYGPDSGVPIRRRPSSILKRNKVDTRQSEEILYTRNRLSGGVQLRDKPGRNMPATSFISEMKSKLRDRKSQANCDVTDDNVDRLYPALTRSLNMDNNAQSHIHSTLQPISQEAESMPETVYTRPFKHSPISIKKPDMSATRVKSKTEKDKGRKNSNPPKQIVLPPEVKRSSSAIDAKPRKEIVGTSFSAEGSVDTLKKQNTNTMLVLSGGDGYKDWKKRQSLQNYRPEEPCLTFWMYKF